MREGSRILSQQTYNLDEQNIQSKTENTYIISEQKLTIKFHLFKMVL